MKMRIISLIVVVLAALPTFAQLAPSRAERAEIRFLQGMVDHHQMALDMANDCLSKSIGDEMKALCQAVIDAQTPEIEQMVAWLDAWYNISYTPMSMLEMVSVPAEQGGHAGHGSRNRKDSDPAGMMGMFAGFNRLDGTEYEIAWMESMIDHHGDAIHMSERIAAVTTRDELRTLAETIIRDQSAEIEAMEAMLTARAAQ